MGVAGAVAGAGRGLVAIAYPSVVRLAETANTLLRLVTPENIRDLRLDEWDRLIEISEEQRIGLLWAPRVKVLRALLAVEDATARARVIDESVDEIVADSAESLARVTDKPVMELAEFAAAAVRAHQAGHPQAAQVLATNVLDSGLLLFADGPKAVLRTAREWRPLSEEEWVSLRVYRSRLAAAGIPEAYRDYKRGRADGAFSRNGTAHVVNGALYTPANSARAISLAVTWLRLVQETSRFGVAWHGGVHGDEEPA